MLEKLREIDTSAVEKLVKIKKEQDRLVGFLGKADEMKGKVDDAVYRRVRADYESRDSALEKEAAPLKEEARGEYEKLCSIYDQLQEALDQAREAKEELEFRHAVGEFDKTRLAEKLKEPEEALEQCRSQLGDTDKLKAQFLAVFHSEEELKGAPQVDSEGPFEIEPEPKMQPEIEPEVQTEIIPEVQTEIIPEVQTEIIPEVQTEIEPEVQSEIEPKVDSTVQFEVEPQAKLVMIKKGEPSDEYPLGVLNYIGRAKDNHIRLTSQTVSRKHALLTASATGFTVKDLESQSGTFVNEEKVTECILADGDRIKIGEVELVFRSA